jgi:hypothetical protein
MPIAQSAQEGSIATGHSCSIDRFFYRPALFACTCGKANAIPRRTDHAQSKGFVFAGLIERLSFRKRLYLRFTSNTKTILKPE